MKPWIVLDIARIPGVAGELRLLQRGDEFSINLGRDALMTSRLRGSEEALAKLACARLDGAERTRLLIGGLGMGFTFRTALALLPASAEIVVAELVPAVIAWSRGPLAVLFGDSLDDPRVSVVEGDVARLIRSAASTFDAILLDVDNGPDGLTRASNDGLYTLPGLRAAWAALRPGGVLAVWSAAADAAFLQRLKKTGFSVDQVSVRANGKRGARHIIWIAVRANRADLPVLPPKQPAPRLSRL